MDKNKVLPILEVATKSGSVYEVYRYNNEGIPFDVLKSDSKAFGNANFILLDKIIVDDKLYFKGDLYFDAEVVMNNDENTFSIESNKENKKFRVVEMKDLHSTTTINNIKINNETDVKDMYGSDMLEFLDYAYENFDINLESAKSL